MLDDDVQGALRGTGFNVCIMTEHHDVDIGDGYKLFNKFQHQPTNLWNE